LPAVSTRTPALLVGDFLSEGIRSAADAAGTFVIVAFDAAVHSLVTFTSAPGAGFGPAVPAGDATSVTASLNLTVPGRPTLCTESPRPSPEGPLSSPEEVQAGAGSARRLHR
jgi:hypothetical protein